MMARPVAWLLAVCVLGPGWGCGALDSPAPRAALLARPQATPDSVALEIFSARYAAAEPEQAESFWTEIDEQQLPAELRRKLADNGLRAGVVGAHLPARLVEVLRLREERPDAPNEIPLASLVEEPKVTLRVLETRYGQRNELLSAPPRERLSVLIVEGEQVGGRSFANADGRFALTVEPLPDGRAQLELLPEIHYGEQQPHWVGDEGMLRFEPGRPRRVFADLRLRVALAPGQLLVLAADGNRSGSLGDALFHDSGAGMQKLLAIRLPRAAPDRAFVPAGEVKPLDLDVVAP